jgi:3D (Asp-Asp-Asp) domain-containing protein
MVLVPYRTIAVDSSQTPIPFGTVIYIPEARGKEITLPSGEVVKHDGYFFAADSGNLIKGSHIDVFSGVSTSNPFPEFVKSRSTETFTAYVINDSGIAEELNRTHHSAR